VDEEEVKCEFGRGRGAWGEMKGTAGSQKWHQGGKRILLQGGQNRWKMNCEALWIAFGYMFIQIYRLRRERTGGGR
jgi:hypothetical protein